MARKLAAVALLALFVVPRTADASFAEQTGSPFAVGNSPHAIASADFNADGRRDLAVGNLVSDNVTVLLRQAGGGYAPDPDSPLATTGGPRSIAVGDFNDDDRPDLGVVSEGGDVEVFLREAAGGFSLDGAAFDSATNATDIAAPNLNGDALSDLVVVANGSVYTFLRTDPDGPFTDETPIPLGGALQPYAVAASDFNADGRPDLAVANLSGDSVTVLLRQSGGGFAEEAGSPFPAGDQPQGIVAADFNRDGRPDLAVPAANGTRPVTVLLRQVGGGFAQEGSPSTLPSFPTDIGAGDFNSDGRPDLAVPNFGGGGGQVTILLRQGGGFTPDPSSPVLTGEGPQSVAVADLNGDVRPDIATANDDDDNASVILNTTPFGEGPPGAPNCSDGADNDGDGLTDGADPGCQSETPVTPRTRPPRPPVVVPPVARFVALGRTSTLGRVVLDAGRTTNASTLLWDLTGDRRTDVTCPGSQPALSLTMTRPAALSVTLTAVGARGATSSASTRVLGGGARLPARAVAQAYESAACAPSAARFIEPQDTKPCTDQTVTFGLVEAVSCFTRVQDRADIPRAEASTINRFYDHPEYPSYVVKTCAAANTPERKRACEQMKAMFDKVDFYVSRRPVRLSGITFTPTGQGSLVIFPTLNRVISSRASMKWGGMQVKGPGPINFNVKSNALTLSKGAGGSAYLLDFDGKRDLPSIAGFRLDGQVSLALKGVNGQRMSEGRLRLSLPPVFSALGGKAPSGEAAALASNGSDPTFSSLAIGVPEALVGPVRMTDLSFRYELNGGIDGDRNPGTSCLRKEWKARGNVFLTGSRNGDAGFKLTPPPSQNGLGFCDGGFKHFGGDVVFGGPIPRPQIFPSVFLNSVGFNVGLNPLLVRGRGTMSVADIADITGELMMVFASPGAPYLLSPRDGASFAPLGLRSLKSTAVALGGTMGIRAPFFGRIPIASGALIYIHPGTVHFNGSGSMVLPGMSLDARLSGAVSTGQGLFSMHGGADACLAGVRGAACLGGDAWITSRGAVACLNVGPLHPGAGHHWGSRSVTIWPLDGCKPSHYWVTLSTRAAGVSSRTFTVERGQTKFVKVGGRGSAPKIRLTAPNGTSITTQNAEFNTDPGRTMQAIAHGQSQATWIGVKGTPGTYRIETLAGSVPIVTMAESRPGYDTNFKARVAGRGRTRTLIYDARRGGRQQVTFVETGDHVFRRITTVRGGKGRIRFKTAVGPRETRQIVAVATLDGVPIPNQTLARFTAGGYPTMRRPRRLTVRRRGKSLFVSWARVPGAQRYGVVMELKRGNERQFVVRARKRSLRIRRVPLTQSGSVRVSAQGLRNEYGPARTRRFKRLRRPPSALVTRHENPRKR